MFHVHSWETEQVIFSLPFVLFAVNQLVVDHRVIVGNHCVLSTIVLSINLKFRMEGKAREIIVNFEN